MMSEKTMVPKLMIAAVGRSTYVYLPFWIIDSTVQRIVLAIGLSIMVYAGKLWLMEQAEK